jgi:uncharacterized membrane protein YoaK (UPF0700 family)
MPAPSEPANQPEPLAIALLLAATGGLLDAVVFLDHGHVFANAMTGNTIFLGISLLTRDWRDALHHTTPLLAFFAGVITSKLARSRLGRAAGPTALLLEVLTLLGVGFPSSSFPQMLFVALIAFASSLQMASFRHVGPYSYNSTFLTGNLRDTAEGLYDSLVPSPPDPQPNRTESLTKARDLGLICLCFLIGAVTGAIAAPRLHNHAFWLPEPLLLLVLFVVLREVKPPAIPAKKPGIQPNQPTPHPNAQELPK